MHNIPEDVILARTMFDEAESFSSNHNKFCNRFMEGLENLMDYLDEDQPQAVKTFARNLIVTYTANLIRRLPTIDLTNFSVWFKYMVIIVEIPKDLLNRIYDEHEGFRDIVIDFRDNWLDELENYVKVRSS